jgi:hypothetical protein
MNENMHDKINSLTERWVMECHQQGELILRTIGCYQENHSPDLRRYNLFRRRLIADVKKTLLSSEIASDLFDVDLELLWVSSDDLCKERRQAILQAYSRLETVGSDSPGSFTHYDKDRSGIMQMLIDERLANRSPGAPLKDRSIPSFLHSVECQTLIDEIMRAHIELRLVVGDHEFVGMEESERKKTISQLTQRENKLGDNEVYWEDHKLKDGLLKDKPTKGFIYEKIKDAMCNSSDWDCPEEVNSVKTADQKDPYKILNDLIIIAMKRLSRIYRL